MSFIEQDIEFRIDDNERDDASVLTEEQEESHHCEDDQVDSLEDLEDATFAEVCRYCCVRTPQEWGHTVVGFLWICFFLYFFLFALELLSSSAKVIGGCAAGELFGDGTNPIAGLMVGILSTVLLQSSSTTTSIIVSLVGSAISTRQSIYMVMGANIGTSVTNSIVALGSMADGSQLELAFSGATVHDLFNFLSVAVFLPVEVTTGYLFHITEIMTRNLETKDGKTWEGPVKKLVHPLTAKLIIPNKHLIKDVADGGSCSSYYPVSCKDGVVSAKTCKCGLICCDNGCPAFFQNGADRRDDEVSGGACFFVALCILLVCFFGLISTLQYRLLGASTRVIFKVTNINGYLAIALGAGITVLVQSSSITTSALTPLVGMGILQLEQMFPLTLGANIGTTVTAILAALVTEGKASLQVALAHLLFNVSGILVWYPIPFMRKVPVNGALQLGKITRMWRGFPVAYIIVMFFVMPLTFLGLSSLFDQDSLGFTVLGSFLTLILGFAAFGTILWCCCFDGRARFEDWITSVERRRQTMKQLPDDMEYLMRKVQQLIEYTAIEEASDKEDPKTDTVPESECSVESGHGTGGFGDEPPLGDTTWDYAEEPALERELPVMGPWLDEETGGRPGSQISDDDQ